MYHNLNMTTVNVLFISNISCFLQKRSIKTLGFILYKILTTIALLIIHMQVAQYLCFQQITCFYICSSFFYRRLPGGPIYWRSMQRNFGLYSQWIWILHWRLNHKTPGIVFLFSSCLIISSEMTVSTCIFFSIWTVGVGEWSLCECVFTELWHSFLKSRPR